MSVTLLGVTLLTSLVLGWSGYAKVRDAGAMADAMRQLRVPAALARPLIQRLFPWGEIGLAVALLVLGGGWLTAAWVAATLLFAAYVLLIARAAARPEQVSCNCFGASPTVVNRWTVARNALLVAVAVSGLIGSLGDARSVIARVAGFDGVEIVAVAGVLLLGAASFVLGRDQAGAPPVATQAEAPAAGVPDLGGDDEYFRQPIPAAVFEREAGQPQLLTSLITQRAVVLFYLSMTCGACSAVFAQLPGYADRLAALDFVIVLSAREQLDLLDEAMRPWAVVDVASSIREGLHINGVPAAAILGTDGLLAGGPVGGTNTIIELLDDVVAEFEAVGIGSEVA